MGPEGPYERVLFPNKKENLNLFALEIWAVGPYKTNSYRAGGPI